MVNKEKIHAYFRLFRLHTSATESLLVIMGALIMGLRELSLLLVLFFIGLIYHIYFFVLNDYGDIEVDKLSNDLQQKPLLSGDIPKKNALIIAITAGIGCYIVTLLFFPSLFAFFVLTLALFFGALYDLYGKKVLGYGDFILGATAAFFFLFGASTVSMNLSTLIYIVALLVFFGCTVANAVEGGLKDVDHDSLGEEKTLATMMGVRVKAGQLLMTKKFAAFSYSLIGVCLILLIWLGFQPEINIWSSNYLILTVAFILIILAIVFSIKLINIKKFDRPKIKRLYVVINSAAGALLLIMILPLIGFEITLILIIVPITWYILFNVLVYGKPLQPLV